MKKVDPRVRHVTKQGVNLFAELGFPATDAKRLQTQSRKGIGQLGASLLKTNPYLLDPKARAAALRISAASSSAIEGICKPFEPDKRTGKLTSASRKAVKSGR